MKLNNVLYKKKESYKGRIAFYNSEWILPLAFFTIGVLFLPLNGVALSPDSSWYLNNALSLYNNFSVDSLIMIRRPLFPLLMSFSFNLFDISVQSGFFIVRLFFLLNILLCYSIGRVFFNKTTGVLFAGLTLTSYEINFWSSYLLVDNIVSFFILLFLLICTLAFNSGKYRYFIISGIVLGIAFLTKGVFAIWFILLPFTFFLFELNRNRFNCIGLLFLYSFFTIVLSPWLYGIFQNKIGLDILLGPLVNIDRLQHTGFLMAHQKISMANLPNMEDLFILIFEKTKLFYLKYIGKPFILSEILIAGLIYSIYKILCKKDKEYTIVIFSLIFFSPVIYVAFNGNGIGFRPGQLMIMWFLLYLLLSATIVDIYRVLEGKKIFLNIRIQKILAVIFFSICFFFQVFIGSNGNANFKKLIVNNASFYKGFSFYKNDFRVGDWGGKNVQNVSQWLINNVKKNQKILCQWHYLQSIDFHTKQNFQISRIVWSKINNANKNRVLKPIFIDPNYKFKGKKIKFGNGFKLVSEDSLLKKINTEKIEYIIVTHRRNFLSQYFDAQKNCDLVKRIGQGKIKIYKMTKFPLEPLRNFVPGVNIKTIKLLRALFEKAPQKYFQEKEIFSYLLKWDKRQAESFFAVIEKTEFKDLETLHSKDFFNLVQVFKEGKIY